ncbi:RAMP superfamily CRISPR-associated protein [Pseudogracilibacillus sp. SO30301A]|uniref:RAMP superfamily CRISPR-associated protein n=1 Tax=Pseudogracilibacillus sp. SO30301A TaxID=3098291 RepID=UPI00300E2131
MVKNKIVRRTYIRLKGELATPLLAGSGENIHTDMDVLRDFYGTPFIAGTAIAGAFRDWLESISTADQQAIGEESIHSLFGAKNTDESDFRQSRIFISDLQLDCQRVIKTRDHVKLSDKIAYKTGKFDVEVIETGTPFTMYLEYIERNSSKADKDKQMVHALISAMSNGELTLGGRTNRGYGKLAITEVREKEFLYTSPKEVQKWLDWSRDKFERAQDITHTLSKYTILEKIEVPLTIKYTLLIRDYKTMDDLDYTFLRANNQPVIPGSTWAGAFRQRLEDIIIQVTGKKQEHDIVEELFGCKHGDNHATPSILQFEESVVTDSAPLTRTRNAIDRFSGATIDGTLFTGESVCKGQTSLIIRWRKQGVRKSSVISDDAIKGILNWLIQDLAGGLLAIGGETSVGRGIFELIEKPIQTIDKPEFAKAAIDYICGGK